MECAVSISVLTQIERHKCVCVCESEGSRRSPGSSAVITGCCLRSLIFRSPPSERRTSFRSRSGIYLIHVKLHQSPQHSSHGVLGRLAGFYSTSRKLSATVSGFSEIMETWFLNHVLGLSLSVLLLALPGLLAAGTPSSNSTDLVTAGITSSAATDELSDLENNATSASYSSESLSPSQRNVLLSAAAETQTAAAGSFGKVTATEACRGKCDYRTLA